MRRILLALGGSLLAASLAFPQMRSDREADGLTGPVRMVRSERLTITNDNGTVTEGPLLPLHEVTYSEAGDLTEIRIYGEDRALRRRTVYLYPPSGRRRTGLVVYGSDGQVMRKTEYAYGGDGQLKSQTNYDYNEDGSLYRKTVIAFAPGSEVQVSDYGPDGAAFKKKPPTLRRAPRVARAADQEDPVRGWGREGDQYFGEDAYGNWTVRLSEISRTRQSGRIVEVITRTYRPISYY